MPPGSDITVQEKTFLTMQNAPPNEVGSVLGLLNHELLHNPEGEAGYFRKMLKQSSMQTEATSKHHWVIYYVVQYTYSYKPRLHCHFKLVSKRFQFSLGQLCKHL